MISDTASSFNLDARDKYVNVKIETMMEPKRLASSNGTTKYAAGT